MDVGVPRRSGVTSVLIHHGLPPANHRAHHFGDGVAINRLVERRRFTGRYGMGNRLLPRNGAAANVAQHGVATGFQAVIAGEEGGQLFAVGNEEMKRNRRVAIVTQKDKFAMQAGKGKGRSGCSRSRIRRICSCVSCCSRTGGVEMVSDPSILLSARAVFVVFCVCFTESL